jgi:large repetitive protein
VLNIDGVNRNVPYFSGSGSTQLTFRYVVQLGEDDSDGLTSGASLVLNGGTIRDTDNNAAVLNFIMPSLTDVIVADTRPKIESFQFNAATYFIGETFTVTALFDQVVTVIGAPTIPINLDTGGLVIANYVSGSGTSNLIFEYTVIEGQNDTNGITITTPLALNGGSIRNNDGLDAKLEFTNFTPTTLRVDGIRPTVVSLTPPVDGSYYTGQQMIFRVTFSEPVFVASGANIKLRVTIGGNTRDVDYLNGSGSVNLNFRYTVVGADLDIDGPDVEEITITGAGRIRDGSTTTGNDAVLTFAPENYPDVLVNTDYPTITSITPPAANRYTEGEALDFTLVFDEIVNVAGGIPTFTVNIGGTNVSAEYISGTGSTNLLFRYVVQAGEEDLDGVTIGASLALNGATIKNVPTLDAVLTLPAVNLTAVLVDAVAPAVSSVTLPTNQTYTSVDTLSFSVVFDEIVEVDGVPELTLTIAGNPVAVPYVSGSGSTTLVFSYPIDPDDFDLDGLNLATNITLAGGAITDLADNDADLAIGAQNLSQIFINHPGNTAWWDLNFGIGSPIIEVTDRSDEGNDLTAAGSERPSYSATGFAGGNEPYASFDGADDVLISSSAVTIRTIFIVMRTQNDFSVSGFPLFLNSAGNQGFEVLNDGNFETSLNSQVAVNGGLFSASDLSHATSLQDNTNYVITVRTDSDLVLNLAELGGINFSGNIAEVLIYSTPLDINQINKVRSYLNTKHVVY